MADEAAKLEAYYAQEAARERQRHIAREAEKAARRAVRAANEEAGVDKSPHNRIYRKQGVPEPGRPANPHIKANYPLSPRTIRQLTQLGKQDYIHQDWQKADKAELFPQPSPDVQTDSSSEVSEFESPEWNSKATKKKRKLHLLTTMGMPCPWSIHGLPIIFPLRSSLFALAILLS